MATKQELDDSFDKLSATALKVKRDRDALLIAAKQAKKYLEPDLVEPGRTVFWNLVAAIKQAEED
jgi:hypothetical protein